MTSIAYLLVALFLPLFPFSMLFNVLYARIRNPVLRGVMLLAWPQVGLAIVFLFDLTPVGFGINWLLAWALLTSLLYAFRALALREIGLWTSFVAISSWALLWILLVNGTDVFQMRVLSAGISAPLVLMALLGAGLEQRFGAAYLGIYGGLAQTIPRFSGVMVVVVLAVVATPAFPTFFAMLSMMMKTVFITPLIAMGVGTVWLLWSWAGARLLQGLIVGPQRMVVADLGRATLWLYITVLTGLLFTGVYWTGAIS